MSTVVQSSRGVKPGEGAIRIAEKDFAKFAQIWNDTQAEGQQTRSDARLAAMQKAGFANSHTNSAQVRQFASKLRDKGVQIEWKEAARFEPKLLIPAWQRSKSPVDAFDLYRKLTNDESELTPDDRKMRIQAFRVAAAGLKKKGVGLKDIGNQRMSAISDEIFVRVWEDEENTSVGEVLAALVKLGVCKEDCKLSALQHKAKVIRAGTEGTEKRAAIPGIELRVLSTRDSIEELNRLAQSYLDGNVELPEGVAADADDDDDDDDDDDELNQAVTVDDADDDDDDDMPKRGSL